MVDDEMGSHLLSLFFTWQQPWRQNIDKNSFLAGMASQRDTNDNVFCSPLLVHAIFAYACVCLRLPCRGAPCLTSLSQNISPRRIECLALQNILFPEAKRLLELEAGRATLTNMQALLLMHAVECDAGRDRQGRTYRYQAMDIYKRLGYASLQTRPSGFQESEDIQQKWRAITRIIWAMYSHDGYVPRRSAAALPFLSPSAAWIAVMICSHAATQNGVFLIWI